MPAKKRSVAPQLRNATPFCEICGEPSMRSSCYCPACRVFIYNKPEDSARAEAMMEAFDKARKCFICQITGIVLELKDHNSPFFLSFDHVIPGKKGKLQCVCRFVNQMKADLSSEEFLLLVPELADHIRTGKPFNKDVIRFLYWHRPRMGRV